MHDPRGTLRRVGLASAFTALLLPIGGVATAAPAARAQRTIDVRVETYNTCGHGCLPTKQKCEAVIGRDCATKLRPWAEERAARVADDVANSRTDVVTTQEIGNNATPTQPGVDVESFRAPLTAAMRARGYAQAPADYAGARHPELGYPLKSGAGRFTYYNARKFAHLDTAGKALPHGLFWLSDSTRIYGKTMTWNILRERRTGARFVVVDMHLEYRKNGATDPNGWTKNWDRVRYTDATRTIAHLTKDNAHTRNLPIVFAGDMNSDSHDAGASAYSAFADAGYTDSYQAAPPARRFGARLASFNGGKIPLPTGDKIDYIFVKNGTRVREWRLYPQTRAQHGKAWNLLNSDHNYVRTTVSLPVVTR